MRNIKFYSEETIRSLDLACFETQISVGLWFGWRGQKYMLFLDQEFMSSMRIIALARMDGVKRKDFFKRAGREVLTMLVESEKHAREALKRIDDTDTLYDIIVDVLFERMYYGSKRDKFHPSDMVIEQPGVDLTQPDTVNDGVLGSLRKYSHTPNCFGKEEGTQDVRSQDAEQDESSDMAD